MIHLAKTNFVKPPIVSIVLLDWTVREKYFTLDYLNNQTLDRERYEIIWIEYYQKQAKEISELMDKYSKAGRRPPVDTWIVMDRPVSEIYHKHKMYNLGILESSGNIVVIMDSDCIVKTTFVETIVNEFEKDDNIVLHFEEIRNINKDYYPFNYPTISQIMADGCIKPDPVIPDDLKSTIENWKIIHDYNYGACFCATKETLISIGGSDEHEDYKGHICGPYDMTFRLNNARFKEKWHPTHFLYHSWHPNQGGSHEYCGPNDGRGMSTTSKEILISGRMLPLVENENIKALRPKSKAEISKLKTDFMS